MWMLSLVKNIVEIGLDHPFICESHLIFESQNRVTLKSTTDNNTITVFLFP